ncbi:MAG: response regulator [Bacteroidales bacterium]
MIWLRNLSIRTKIIILIVSVSTINLILASLVQYNYERHIYNIEIKQKLHILIQVAAENTAAAIYFGNMVETKNTLDVFKADNHVSGAIVLKTDSTIYAEYKRPNKILDPKYQISLISDTIIFDKNVLISSKPIYHKGEFCGALRIEYDLSGYLKKERQYLIVMFYIIASSVLTAAILAYILQRGITKPIFNLFEVMNQISARKDYSIRSELKSRDEIGKLAGGFNFMIAQIELQNNELKKAKAQSDSSLQEKEKFLANMTHELRTPLTSIMGLSSLLEETELSDIQKDYLENIKHSSDHLLAIINDLLEFSKLGSGKIQLEKNEFSVRKTIDRIERSMEFELRNRKLKFITEIDESVPHLLVGDEYRLNQILINLVGNAVKFTPAGSIRIKVKSVSEDLNTVKLEFWVIDTGIGIVKEKQSIIFDSFTQESSETNRKYGGTGLGLAITRQLVEIQHGNINVQSEKGAGSSFIFDIPYQKVLIQDTVKLQEQLVLLKGKSVLIADDNPMNLLFTKSILEKNNFLTDTSNNGEEALQKLRQNDYDLILLDLHMPQMDGYELSRIIRSFSDTKKSQIPVIALTAAATLNEIKKCFDSGMNDYLVKPFKKEELLTKIISLLLNRPGIRND